jgi:hypothetical protein
MCIDESIVNLWWHYEEIAMHFNELIMQYRLQLMGGAGAIGAISSYFIGSHVQKPERRHTIRAYVATVMIMLLIAASLLDLLYYNELLQGAVDALKKFEMEHPEIYMSTLIEHRFKDPISGETSRGTEIIYYVYGIIIIPLALFTIWSWYVFAKERLQKNSTNND